ncbi:MAG: hypothetical protein KJZ84_13475 [Bryobacteraceae bacterium]|nr:hypothetical protein [Bryobacteraceae bacterium]
MELSNAGLLLTFALAVATVWLAINRFGLKLENNWPLVYYGLLVVFLHMYPLVLNPYVIYVAVVSGLLLRFEFLNDRIILFVRIVEMLCFAVIGWGLFQFLLKQF